MHEADTSEWVRVEIVLDVHNANPDLLFMRAAARAIALVVELRRDALRADIVSIDVHGDRHYRW